MRGNQSVATADSEETVARTAIEQLWQYVTGRRRSFLVDRPYQLRVTGMGLLFVLALLIPLNVSVYYSLVADPTNLQAAPELGAYLHAQDWKQFLFLVLASTVFLFGYFTISLIETHRTAGAAFAIRRQVEKLADGRFGLELKLRADDNLIDLAAGLNRLSLTLRSSAAGQADELDTLAGEMENHATDPAAREMASRLRVLAARTREPLA